MPLSEAITFYTITFWNKILVLVETYFHIQRLFAVSKKQSSICNLKCKKIHAIEDSYYLLLITKKNLMRLILMLKPVF